MLCFNCSVVVSGGDDALMKVWDWRNAIVSLTNRHHSSGVTSLCNDIGRLLTGSYDEHLRVFDTRLLDGDPVSTLNVGGGAWHIDHDHRSQLILVACMYNGWCLAKLSPYHDIIKVDGDPSNGQQLLYGVSLADVDDQRRRRNLAAMCTFNNKRIFLKILTHSS